MFNKSYEEGKVVYRTDKLRRPDLIREEQLEEVLTKLGYTLIKEGEKRDSTLKSTDFLLQRVGFDDKYLRNRGWQIEIEVEVPFSKDFWKMEVKGNPKKEGEIKKIADALEIETYKEAKKLAESSGEGIAWKELLGYYANLLLEEKIRGK